MHWEQLLPLALTKQLRLLSILHPHHHHPFHPFLFHLNFPQQTSNKHQQTNHPPQPFSTLPKNHVFHCWTMSAHTNAAMLPALPSPGSQWSLHRYRMASYQPWDSWCLADLNRSNLIRLGWGGGKMRLIEQQQKTTNNQQPTTTTTATTTTTERYYIKSLNMYTNMYFVSYESMRVLKSRYIYFLELIEGFDCFFLSWSCVNEQFWWGGMGWVKITLVSSIGWHRIPFLR